MPVREQRKITVYGVARNGLTADKVLSQAYSQTLYLPPPLTVLTTRKSENAEAWECDENQ